MLEILLWLLLIWHICLKSAPYVLGLIVAVIVVHHAIPGIPTGHIAAVFVVVAVGTTYGLKDALSGKAEKNDKQ
jgi:hypothetical protein